MSALDWPALEGATLKTDQMLSVEHAVWGKVHGQKSDFRWIARSPGFDTRLAGSEFRIGAEDRPARLPLWRFVGGRYYAISCYPVPVADESTRSNFLEKQLLEWTPDGVVPPAAVAMSLLALASGFNHEIWFDRHADPEWSDPRHVLAIPPMRVTISRSHLETTIAEACDYWRQQPAEMLVDCFAGLDLDETPAYLTGAASPLAPIALAALLLPLSRERADRSSIAGWVPAEGLDDGGGDRWDLVATRSRSGDARAPALAAILKAEALRSADPRLARGVQPWVQRLLDFTEGSDRWLELPALGPQGDPPSSGEEAVLRRAAHMIREMAMKRLADYTDELADARRRHLERKAEVVDTACEMMSKRGPAT